MRSRNDSGEGNTLQICLQEHVYSISYGFKVYVSTN